MNSDLQNFDYQPADKLGKLLRGQKDTFAPVVSALRGRAPPLPRRFRRLCFVLFQYKHYNENCNFHSKIVLRGSVVRCSGYTVYRWIQRSVRIKLLQEYVKSVHWLRRYCTLSGGVLYFEPPCILY